MMRGNLEAGVIAKIRMPIGIQAMGEILKEFAKHYPGCCVRPMKPGANTFEIVEKEAAKE